MENEKRRKREKRLGEFEVAAAGRRGGERQDLEEMEKRRGRGREKKDERDLCPGEGDAGASR